MGGALTNVCDEDELVQNIDVFLNRYGNVEPMEKNNTSISSQCREDPSLVIISGAPRSGTTWLGKLFDSHPLTLYRHEPDSVERLEWLPLIVDSDYSQYETSLQTFVDRIPKIRDPKVSASTPVFRKAFDGPLHQFLVKCLLHAGKLLSLVKGRAMIPRYCLPGENQSYILVWKTIESSGRLGLYADMLPQKRIIHILRHPGAVVSSRLRGESLNKFGGYHAEDDYAVFRMLLESSVGRRREMSLAQIKAMNPVERLVWAYVISSEKVLEDLEGRPDCRIIVYEDLCTQPLDTLQQLFAFCCLNFDPQTRDFLRKSTSQTGKKYYSIFKNPLESAYKWKRELTKDDQKLVYRQLEHSSLARFWCD